MLNIILPLLLLWFVGLTNHYRLPSPVANDNLNNNWLGTTFTAQTSITSSSSFGCNVNPAANCSSSPTFIQPLFFFSRQVPLSFPSLSKILSVLRTMLEYENWPDSKCLALIVANYTFKLWNKESQIVLTTWNSNIEWLLFHTFWAALPMKKYSTLATYYFKRTHLLGGEKEQSKAYKLHFIPLTN